MADGTNDHKDQAELVARRLYDIQEAECAKRFVSLDRFRPIERIVYALVLGGVGWLVTKLLGH